MSEAREYLSRLQESRYNRRVYKEVKCQTAQKAEAEKEGGP
jgi:hypothetical protein